MSLVKRFASAVWRYFDWRFFLCLALALLAFGLVFSLAFAAQDNAAKGRRLDRQSVQIDHLISQNDNLIAQIESERALAAADRAELQAKFKALLVYLRARGIQVPADLIPAENADSSTVRAESDSERRRREAATRPKASSGSSSSSGSNSSGGTGSTGGSGGSDSPGKSGEHRQKPKKDKPGKGGKGKSSKGDKK